jgi:type II secretory pathway pseudopilin PulG
VRRPRGDAGTSLVELLVVMLLMGIVASVVTAWQLSMQRTTTGLNATVGDQSDVRTALAYLTSDLRMAIRPYQGEPAFLGTSTGKAVSFYVNEADSPPTLVRYAVETVQGTTRLVREETPGVVVTGTGAPFTWTGAKKTRVLLANLSTPTDPFIYYSVAAAAQVPCSETADADCAQPLPAASSLADPDDIGAVEVRLAARTKAADNAGSDVTTRVRVANAGLTAIFP